MTVSELRKWLAEKNLPDQWWLSLDTVTEDEPVTLNQAAVRVASGDYESCFVLHVSKTDEADPEWIELTGEEKVVPQMSAVQKPVKKMEPQQVSSSGSSEVFGILLLSIPLCGALVAWFWVGAMALIQDPGGTLNLILIGVIVVTAILIGIEASQLGMGKSDRKGDHGPITWVIVTLFLWIIAYPWYLFARGKHGARSLGFAGILCAVIFAGVGGIMTFAIEEQKSEIRAILRGGPPSSGTRDMMREINRSVTEDFIRQYEIVKRRGNEIEASVHAGLVAESYLQQGNEAEYRKWKEIQEAHERKW